MRYLYTSEKGETVEISFPIGQALEAVEVDGEIYERDIEAELGSKEFVLKGGGWPGQDTKRKHQMTRLNEEAGHRTQKTWGKPKKCVPNYKGEVCESWREASSLAKKEKKD